MSASIDGSVMKHGRHIAAAVACSLWLTPGGAAAGAENLARIGTPLLGVGVGVTGAGDVTVTHQGPLGEVNDGVLNLNLAADGFQISADGQSGPDGNGADTYAAGISTGAFDFVGVQFAESQYGVTSVRVQNYLANDGGWWGPTNVAAGGAPLGPGDLIAPQVQVSSDGGGSWRTVSASSDYVSLYQGVVRGSGFPKATSGPAATFTFAEQNGIDAIRLIGGGAGPADGNGFIGVNEFEVFGVPQELSLRVDVASGLVEVVGAMHSSISFDYYEITSASGSLNVAGWNRLAEPGGNPAGFPAGGGAGSGWETLGAPAARTAAEGYLLSDSTLASGERLTLGYLFARTEQDLTFRYRTANGRVVEADVQYAPGMAGDFDGDGDVSGSDLLAWQRHYETAFGPADLAAWRLNFGNGAAATAAPELASARLATVAAGLVLMFRAERRGAERRHSPDGDC